MPNRIDAWECEYCGRKYMCKSSARRHEKECFANPETKSCRTCSNYSLEIKTVYNRNHGGCPGETDYEELYFWCSGYNKELKNEPETMVFVNDQKFEPDHIRYKTNCKKYVKGKKNW